MEDKKVYPIESSFTWKSTIKKFETWNKEFKEKVHVLPDEFIMLDEMSTITWWHDKSSSGIYSNRVKMVWTEDFAVKAFNMPEAIHKGTYSKDTKHLFEAVWGVFNKALIVLENGKIYEYLVKGSALFQTNEDLKNINTNEYKVKMGEPEQKKKGSVTYSVPHFVQGSKLTPEEIKERDEQKAVVLDYFSREDKTAVADTSLPF